ncbi:MAG: hypothetical protein DME65_08605 [Verrucomicrobia bacterium]|nr:MAG: hypothetical protein DME65_08605 [Verrucomicrobiota bacterium]
MKRILLLIIAFAVAAYAGWYYWNLSQQVSSAPVASLLPRQTIFLADMPDFNRTLAEWRQSDVYQLYREPAVQDFLRKPLANVQKQNPISETLQEMEQLDPKNVFFALTSISDNAPSVVGGFRFRGTQEDAERVIGKWRRMLLDQRPGAKSEKVQYQGHEIDVAKATPFTLAITYDPPWFFAATNVTELKALLDRVDRRAKNSSETLDKDEAYHTAVSHRPSTFTAFFYLQPKAFSERLAALRAAVQSSPTPGETTMLEKMRCIAGSTRFENGKIRDVLFLGMPKLENNTTLSRSSLTLGTKDTFFYLALLLNLGEKMETLNHAATLSGAVQKAFQDFGVSGIAGEDWKAAFGLELGALADWPASAHWPSLLLTLPVLDKARASKIIETFTHADDGAIWTQTEKDGVRYFSKQSTATLVAITPTIALSDRIFIAGLNPVSVEEGVKRSMGSSSHLADSQTYKAAERLLPAPTNFFSYVDTALLYSRLDASLRPMLLMAAAFMPAIARSVDLAKIPSPEVITKHLSPIISSQRYERADGYVAESLGPITLDQSAIGLAVLSSLGTAARQQARTGLGTWMPSSTATPQPTMGSPSPTP